MRRYASKFSPGCFFFGLGSQLQLLGTSLSFTELFVFTAAPVLLLRELAYLRRNGLMTFFWLSMAVVVGGAVACVANHSPMYSVIRGMSVVCSLPCTIVVGHWMLRRDMNGFKWWVVGSALSMIVCTFFFRQAVEVNMLAGGVADKNTTEAIMSGPIFWISRLGPLLTAPLKSWYLQSPVFFSVGVPLFLAGFAMLASSSGRAAALGALGSAVLVFFGGKKQQTMRRIGRYFWGLFFAGIVGVFVAKEVYAYAAIHNWLGEKSRQKYEMQTRGGKSVMALLLGGRMDSFCGLIACVDKPIIGFGPWALDYGGYRAEFLSRFGTAEDFEEFVRGEAMNGTGRVGAIPCHSTLTEFWLWYGIFGLVFCLYILFALARYLRQDCWAVPQWYMWLAASIPSFCWNLFFSPWGNRVGNVLFVVACLVERAVRKGRQPLPQEMIVEIQNANRG